jgi:hypothetical protein
MSKRGAGNIVATTWGEGPPSLQEYSFPCLGANGSLALLGNMLPASLLAKPDGWYVPVTKLMLCFLRIGANTELPCKKIKLLKIMARKKLPLTRNRNSAISVPTVILVSQGQKQNNLTTQLTSTD